MGGSPRASPQRACPMTTAPALSADELGQLLRQADPAVLLVPPRILRRVIKQDRRPGGLGLQVPHADSYVLSRDALLRIATPGELGVPPGDEVRAVLDQDRMLLPPADAAGVYEEFAATYLELRCFEPERLAQTFPGLTDRAAVDALLAEDVDAD